MSPQLAEILKNPALMTALQVCDQSAPANGGNRQWEQPHLAHIQLGIDRGYNLYPQILKMLAQRPRKVEEPKTSYEVVKEEEQ